MLILSRKPGESLVMTTESGEEIQLIVLQSSGIQVRMGVDANHSVTIDREEIHLKKQAEAKDV
ncbi:carbon storage regulator [Marinobacter adhaerens]|uniref:Carbon storage regulator n=1 Tax=Marinobacter adhaerens TaxID=1033846 RepID=A0A851HS79_9GAMM|nr:carbon storage regulator [Marinobacter adhaerens]NWN92264.1 carbon storage regulator [Marinobacter adhaerens]